ncbi:MAG: glycosyl hydrolase [Bacteroidota bacterium]
MYSPTMGSGWLKNFQGSLIFAVLLSFLVSCIPDQSDSELEQGFSHPPDQVKPWTYWFFYNDHISREGIDLDLEAMKEAGIGTALLFSSVYNPGGTGDVPALTEDWWKLLKYAIRRAGEEGIHIGLFNCFGWSQSGGPWIPDEKSMRHLVTREIQVSGPVDLSLSLTAPKGFFQDVRILAFPSPKGDRDQMDLSGTTITGSPASRGIEAMFDGDMSSVFTFPESALEMDGSYEVNIKSRKPFEARSLQIHPSSNQFLVTCELLAKDASGEYEKIRTFEFQRPPDGVMDIGPLWDGPGAISFPVTRSTHYKLRFSNFRFHEFFGRNGSKPGFTEIELSGAAQIDHYVEKQLSKVFPMPLPMWDDYLWDQTDSLDDPAMAIPAGKVLDISNHLEDGKLEWQVPPGEWTILRVSMVSTGAKNAPVLPNAEGPEVDKLNREHAIFHFDQFAGQVIREIPAKDRMAIKYLVIDSYETGSQNWSDDLEIPFKEAYGYDPVPWLPVFTGRVVGSVEQSERFMWDLRRLVSDRISHEYIGGLKEITNRHGWKLWLENYGHWGFPGEFLQYGGAADLVSGEFWTVGELGSIELRAASSAAHTYGKREVFAESFTSAAPHYLSHPWYFKKRGDWSFTEGVNHTLLTEYLHQAYTDRVPGVNAWFGSAFNRNNTWFFEMDSWVTYLKRCNYLLRQGTYVADLAYFIGEDTPKMTGIRDPELPEGYSFDYINAEVILRDMYVRNGRLILPDGMSYKLLVLPPLDHMRPGLLKKITDLVAAGGNIYGPPPDHSPSLENYPEADDRVKELADALWKDCDGINATSVSFGKGRIFNGTSLEQVLEQLETPPDLHLENNPGILWIHRSTEREDIYFLTNQTGKKVWIDPLFRVHGRQPECWDAVSGKIRKTAMYELLDKGTKVALELNPLESVFVLFRDKADKEDPLQIIRQDGEEIRIPAALTGKGTHLEIPVNGTYSVTTATGNTHHIVADDIPIPLKIAGPWKVRYSSGWGAPDSVSFPRLIDWTLSDHPGIRHYSGSATYHKQMEIPERFFRNDLKLMLDLGRVGEIATVTINGKALGNYWHRPMEIDVTEVLHPGTNQLQIEVTSTWRNRLIGDAAEPEKAKTWVSTDLQLTGDEELIPSGLMGPVQIKAIKTIHVKN